MADTIFALATAAGRSAVAVVRISGPRAGEALRALAGGRALPAPRRASLRVLAGPDGTAIDRALVLWFPGPDSFTGEDCAELHLHGGPAVADAAFQALAGLGLRPAEPGEFTRRAFEHGRLDLSQAEAIADLVDAQSEAQRRQALGQLDGALGRRYEAWRGGVLEVLALLEAAIDFPDEDLPQDVAARALPYLRRLRDELEDALKDAGRGEQVREGWRIAIVGAPNAGKSSLLNALTGREAAIVTPIAGTTRDLIEQPLALGPYRALIADTAGLRPPQGEIEAEGVRRARAFAEAAAVRLWVVDGSGGASAWREACDLVGPGDVLVLNKADLRAGPDAAEAEAFAAAQGLETAPVSVLRDEGIVTLRALLETRAANALSGAEFPAATRERHRRRLEEAFEHVTRGLAALEAGPELAAEDVRLAGRALGRVTGRIDPEEVLDRIFATFCIGK